MWGSVGMWFSGVLMGWLLSVAQVGLPAAIVLVAMGMICIAWGDGQ